MWYFCLAVLFEDAVIFFVAVLFEDAVILGVASDTLTDKARPHGESCATERPYCSIERMVKLYSCCF